MAFISLSNTKPKASYPNLNYWLTLFIGSAAIVAWTLIRFFNKAANFDQVGQLVLAHQWLHGQHSGSVIGPTNYVLKMLFLYMPADLIPVSAQLKLLVLTLLINILTFGLLLIGLKLIWQQLYGKPENNFYLPMIWLALLSGSIFWISFSNSRNLEIAGGVFLVYLFLRILAKPSNRYYGFLVLLGSFLFFADPLQIYMTLLPLLIFSGIRLLTDKDRSKRAVLVKLIGYSVVCVVLARLITKVVERLFNVSFIATNQSVGFKLSSVRLAAEQTARLYAGGYESGRVCQALNLLAVAVILVVTIWTARYQRRSRPILILGACFWLTDLVIYIISGQAQQSDTNRYLIMTVPVFLLMTAVVLRYLRSLPAFSYVITVILVFNILSLSRAFAIAWDPSLRANAHDRAAIAYLKSHNYPYGYASINTAMSSEYLSRAKVNLLPVGCDPDHILKKANLFFDKSVFKFNERYNGRVVPLILDGNSIVIAPTTCATSEIVQQLGAWQTVDHLSDGSLVLLYKANQFQALRGF